MFNRIPSLFGLALLSWVHHCSASSLPFIFGLTSELRSLTSALEKDSADQLLNLLKYHSLQQICHYDSQPRTNSTSIAIASPFNELQLENGDLLTVSLPSIFRNITIKGDWNDAAKRIHALENCPAAGRYARSLKVEIFIWKELERPPKYLALKLAALLGAMQVLEKIVLVIPEYHAAEFEAELTNLTFPEVRTLVVGPYCEFATKLCPNLQILSSNGWPFKESHRFGFTAQNHTVKFIQAAGNVPNLTRLEIDEYLNAKLLNDVLDAVPDIPSLAFNIALELSWSDDALERLLPILARFTNLQYLALPSIGSLGVGFNPPGCGNVYLGPRGEEYRRQVAEKGWAYTVKAADMVFPACQTLRDLWIGEWSHAEARRTENGSVAGMVWRTCPKRDIVFDRWARL